MGKFFIRRVPSGIKFDLRAPNGEVILTSEVYTTLASCRSGIASIRKNAERARVEDQTAPEICQQSNPKFQVFRDKMGQFRFRLRARNGEIIGVSEGYAEKIGCLAGIESVRRNAPLADIATLEA